MSIGCSGGIIFWDLSIMSALSAFDWGSSITSGKNSLFTGGHQTLGVQVFEIDGDDW